jgi:NOL1/NOP2/fmu family ribosome biogenesis protein
MFFKIFDKSKKKNFLNNVEKFGIEKISELLIKSGKERIRAYTGGLSKDELSQLIQILPVESIGLYVGKEIFNKKTKKGETRLSLDGVNFWNKQISERIITLDKEQEERWFKGEDIDVNENQVKDVGDKGFVLLKSSIYGDLIGTGKLSTDNTVFNFLPKERRRRN